MPLTFLWSPPPNSWDPPALFIAFKGGWWVRVLRGVRPQGTKGGVCVLNWGEGNGWEKNTLVFFLFACGGQKMGS